MDATILIATYGDDEWKNRGETCFDDHCRRFPDVPVVFHHGSHSTLAQARNEVVDAAHAAGHATEWLCFVDADDHLEPGYFDAFAAAVESLCDHQTSQWDLWAPAIRYGPGSDPMVFRDRNIRTLNPCVIGTLIHRAMFEQVGRFWEERAWEDWSLFRRAWIAGAKIHHVAAAVYQAGDSPVGRNSTVKRPEQLHADIVESHRRWASEKGYM